MPVLKPLNLVLQKMQALNKHIVQFVWCPCLYQQNMRSAYLHWAAVLVIIYTNNDTQRQIY